MSANLRTGVFMLCLVLSSASGRVLEPSQPTCGSADLTLTEEQERAIKEIVSQGGGLVPFVGRSGSGKTLAALAIAAEKGVEVYRIDSARVMSK